LQSAEQGGKLHVTNTAQLHIERQLGELATKAVTDRSGALSSEAIRRAIDGSGLDFEREADHGRAQRAAIYALGQGSALTLLTGAAGSGKTTLLKPLVTAWAADTRFDQGGREIIGLATGWRQADALKDAGITRTIAIAPLLKSIEAGEFEASRNTVLVIDEIGQVAPRAMLALLELQQKTGLTIKGLGDREQAQAIEAGDAIEILQRALPKTDQVELLSTIRQVNARDRTIASLFRGKKNDRTLVAEAIRPDGNPVPNPVALHLQDVKTAFALKRQDGTARFVGGDYEQVLERIADFYMERRDALTAAGATRGITMSVLTNEDAADLSRAVRQRMKIRGEISSDETVYQAIDQRREIYDIPIATGDRLRLFRRTWAMIDGEGGSIGNNGDIVEVAGRWDGGLLLKDQNNRVGKVEWRRLKDDATGRLCVGFGHAMTVDAAQGITSDEHINALPRGTAGMTGFKAYVAESRARGSTWTMISDEATFDAVRKKRALGDITPIKADDMWDEVAKNMAAKPYKQLAIDLIPSQMGMREKMVRGLMREGQRVEKLGNRGIDAAKEFRYRMEAARHHGSLVSFKAQLDKAIADAETSLIGAMTESEIALRKVRVDTVFAERNQQTPRLRSSSVSPGM
jgi:energy-coupling factor transporter ATP-binding protein EcfA2